MDINFKKFDNVRHDDDELLVHGSADRDRDTSLLHILDDPTTGSKGRAKVRLIRNLHDTVRKRDESLVLLKQAQQDAIQLSSECIVASRNHLHTCQSTILHNSSVITTTTATTTTPPLQLTPALKLEQVRHAVKSHSTLVENRRRDLQDVATIVRSRLEAFRHLDEEVKSLRRAFIESSSAYHIEVAAKCDLDDLFSFHSMSPDDAFGDYDSHNNGEGLINNNNNNKRSSGGNGCRSGSGADSTSRHSASTMPNNNNTNNSVSNIVSMEASIASPRCISPFSVATTNHNINDGAAITTPTPTPTPTTTTRRALVDGMSIIPVIDDSGLEHAALLEMRNMQSANASRMMPGGIRFIHDKEKALRRVLSSSGSGANSSPSGDAPRQFPVGLGTSEHAQIIIRKQNTVAELTKKNEELELAIESITPKFNGGGSAASGSVGPGASNSNTGRPLSSASYSNLVSWRERAERIQSQLLEASVSLSLMLDSDEGQAVRRCVVTMQTAIRRRNAMRQLRSTRRFKSAVDSARVSDSLSTWRMAISAARHNRSRLLRKVFNVLVSNADEHVHRRTRFIQKVLRARGISTQRRILLMWYRYTKYLLAPVHPISMMREITFSDDEEVTTTNNTTVVATTKKDETDDANYDTAALTTTTSTSTNNIAPQQQNVVIITQRHHHRELLPAGERPFRLVAWKKFVDSEHRRVRLLRSGVFFGTDPLLNQAYFLHRWRKYVARKRTKRYFLKLAALHENQSLQGKHFYAWLNLTTFSAQKKATAKAKKVLYFTIWKRFVYRNKREEEQLLAFKTVKKLSVLHRWRRRTVDARRTSVASHVRMVLNRASMWFPVLSMLTAADPRDMMDGTHGSSGGYAYRMVEGGTATQAASNNQASLAYTSDPEREKQRQRHLGSTATHNASINTSKSISSTRAFVSELLKRGKEEDSVTGLPTSETTNSIAAAANNNSCNNNKTIVVQKTLMMGGAGSGDAMLQDPTVAAMLRKKYWEYVTERVFVSCWKTWKGYTTRRLVYRQFLVARWQRRVRRLKGGCFSAWRLYTSMIKLEKAGNDPFDAVPQTIDAKRMESTMYVESAGELLEDLSIITYKIKRTTLIRRYLVMRQQLDGVGNLTVNDEDLEEVLGIGDASPSASARQLAGAPPTSGRYLPNTTGATSARGGPSLSTTTNRLGSRSGGAGGGGGSISSSGSKRDSIAAGVQLSFNPLGLFAKEVSLIPLSDINRERSYTRAAFAHWMRIADQCLYSPLLRCYIPDFETESVFERGHRMTYRPAGQMTSYSNNTRGGSSFGAVGGVETVPSSRHVSMAGGGGGGTNLPLGGSGGSIAVPATPTTFDRQMSSQSNQHHPTRFSSVARGVSFCASAVVAKDSRFTDRTASGGAASYQDHDLLFVNDGPMFGGDLYMLRSFIQMLFLRRKRDKEMADNRRQAALDARRRTTTTTSDDHPDAPNQTLSAAQLDVGGGSNDGGGATPLSSSLLSHPSQPRGSTMKPRTLSHSGLRGGSMSGSTMDVMLPLPTITTTSTPSAMRSSSLGVSRTVSKVGYAPMTTGDGPVGRTSSMQSVPSHGASRERSPHTDFLAPTTNQHTNNNPNGRKSTSGGGAAGTSLSELASGKAKADMLIVLCTGYPLHAPASNEVSIRFMGKLISDECDRNFILQTRRKRRNDRILRKFEVRLRAMKFAESSTSSFMASPMAYRIAGTSPFEMLVQEYKYRAEQSKKIKKKGGPSSSSAATSKKFKFPLPAVERKRHLPFLLRLHLPEIIASSVQASTNIQNRKVIHFKAHLSILWLQLARLKPPTIAPGSALAGDLLGDGNITPANSRGLSSGGGKLSVAGMRSNTQGGGSSFFGGGGGGSSKTIHGLNPFQQQLITQEGEHQREAIISILRTFEDRSLSSQYFGLKVREAVRSQLASIQSRLRLGVDNRRSTEGDVDYMDTLSPVVDDLDATQRPTSATSIASSTAPSDVGRRSSLAARRLSSTLPSNATRLGKPSSKKRIPAGVFYGPFPPHVYDLLDLVGFNPYYLRRGLAQQRTQRMENVKAILSTQRALRALFRDYADLKSSPQVSFCYSATAPSIVGAGWNTHQKPSRSRALMKVLQEEKVLHAENTKAKTPSSSSSSATAARSSSARNNSNMTLYRAQRTDSIAMPVKPLPFDGRQRRWSYMSLEEALGYQERIDRRSRAAGALPLTDTAQKSLHVGKIQHRGSAHTSTTSPASDVFYNSSGLLWPECDVHGYHDVPRSYRPWVVRRLESDGIIKEGGTFSSPSRPQSAMPPPPGHRSSSSSASSPQFRYGMKRPSLHTEAFVGKNYGNKGKLRELQMKLLSDEKKAGAVGLSGSRRSGSLLPSGSQGGRASEASLRRDNGDDDNTSMSVGRSYRVMSAPAVMRTGARTRRRHTDGADELVQEALRDAAIANADALAANETIVFGGGTAASPFGEDDILHQTLHLGDLHDDRDNGSKKGNWKGESLHKRAKGAELKLDYVFGEQTSSQDESDSDRSDAGKLTFGPNNVSSQRPIRNRIDNSSASTSPSSNKPLKNTTTAVPPALDTTLSPTQTAKVLTKEEQAKQAKIQANVAEFKAAQRKKDLRNDVDYEALEREAAVIGPDVHALRDKAQALADLLEKESRASTTEERDELHKVHEQLQRLNAHTAANSVRSMLDSTSPTRETLPTSPTSDQHDSFIDHGEEDDLELVHDEILEVIKKPGRRKKGGATTPTSRDATSISPATTPTSAGAPLATPINRSPSKSNDISTSRDLPTSPQQMPPATPPRTPSATATNKTSKRASSSAAVGGGGSRATSGGGARSGTARVGSATMASASSVRSSHSGVHTGGGELYQSEIGEDGDDESDTIRSYEGGEDDDEFYNSVNTNNDTVSGQTSTDAMRPSTGGATNRSPGAASASSRPPTGPNGKPSSASINRPPSSSRVTTAASVKQRNSSAASSRSQGRVVRFESSGDDPAIHDDEGGGGGGEGSLDDNDTTDHHTNVDSTSLAGSTSRPPSRPGSRPVSALVRSQSANSSNTDILSYQDSLVALDVQGETKMRDDDEELMMQSSSTALSKKRSSLQNAAVVSSSSSLPRKGSTHHHLYKRNASVVHPSDLSGTDVLGTGSKKKRSSVFGEVRVEAPEEVDFFSVPAGEDSLYHILAAEVQLDTPIPRLWNSTPSANNQQQALNHQGGRPVSVSSKGAMEHLIELSARHGAVLDAKKRLHMDALRKDLLALVSTTRSSSYHHQNNNTDNDDDQGVITSPNVSRILRDQFEPPSSGVDRPPTANEGGGVPVSREYRTLTTSQYSLKEMEDAKREEELTRKFTTAKQLSAVPLSQCRAATPLSGGASWKSGSLNRGLKEATTSVADRSRQLAIAMEILDMLPAYLREELEATYVHPSQRRSNRNPVTTPSNSSPTKTKGRLPRELYAPQLTDEDVARVLTATVKDIPAALTSDAQRGNVSTMMAGPDARKAREFMVKTCAVSNNKRPGTSSSNLSPTRNSPNHHRISPTPHQDYHPSRGPRGSTTTSLSASRIGGPESPPPQSSMDFRTRAQKEAHSQIESNMNSTLSLLDDMKDNNNQQSSSHQDDGAVSHSDMSQSLGGYTANNSIVSGAQSHKKNKKMVGSRGVSPTHQLHGDGEDGGDGQHQLLSVGPDVVEYDRNRRLLLPPSIHAFRALTSGSGSHRDKAQAKIVSEALAVPSTFFRKNPPPNSTKGQQPQPEKQRATVGLTQRLREQVQTTGSSSGGDGTPSSDNYYTIQTSPNRGVGQKSAVHAAALADSEASFNKWLEECRLKLKRQPTFQDTSEDVQIQIRTMRRRREGLQSHRDDPFACKLSALLGFQIDAVSELLSMPDPGPEALFDAVTSKISSSSRVINNSNNRPRPASTLAQYPTTTGAAAHMVVRPPPRSASAMATSSSSPSPLTDNQTGKLVAYIRNVKNAAEKLSTH